MDWKWVLQAYGIFVLAAAFPMAMIAGGSIGHLVAATIFLALATVYFEPLYRFGQRWIPSYLERFPRDSRCRMESRHRNATRAILAVWAGLWIWRAAAIPHRVVSIRIPVPIVLTWIVAILGFTLVWEYARYRTAMASSTYEEFQLRFSPLGSWITAGFFLLGAAVTMHIFTT